MRKLPLAIIAILLGTTSLWANIRLPALVGDNMVLQRDTKLSLWGWADAGEQVTVSFQQQKLTAQTGADRRWALMLAPVAAGGPYQMTVQGRNSITLQNILVGEVWLASGQSNMEFPLEKANQSAQEIAGADFPAIRLFTVNKDFAFQPRPELGAAAGWRICSPQTVPPFSAVAYLFGRALHQRYQVPIGLIQSVWGGTPAETWTSLEGLKRLDEFGAAAAEIADTDPARFRAVQQQRDAWYKEFGALDRGAGADSKAWADPDLATDGWPTMKVPAFWSTVKSLKGFDGVIWFRKAINVPQEAAGQPLTLHLSAVTNVDTTYFNGVKVGGREGWDARNYQVPGNVVKAGRNVITVRLKGVNSFGGMYGDAAEMQAAIGALNIPLAGDWLYQPGPDLTALPELLLPVNPNMPQNPALLFNAMIAPVIPYTIKGVIWYQGESNAGRSYQYRRLFPALIQDWRRRWGYDFPFLFVQLAGYQADKPQPADYGWAELREAQAMTLALPGTGMVTAIDIGEESDVHPRNKQDVAHRLVLAAQKVAYGEAVVYSGPTFQTLKIEGAKARLSFANTGSGLWIKDKYGYLRGFAIAGADKKFVWAQGYQEGNNLIVFNPTVKNPVAVRYNWGNTPDGNLYNQENLPAVPFRTDDWPGVTINAK